MGLFKKLFKLAFASVAVVIGVLIGPNPLPESVKFTEFYVTPLKNFGGVLTMNELLNNAERLFENEIKGPEAFEVINGELYTSLHGGFVAKVFEDQIIPVVKFGEPCVGWYEESKCGRPLGIKALGNDHLLVADAYYGIFKYNLKTKKSVNLVDKDEVIDGKKAKTFNSIAVGRDGTIYWTHSSSDFTIENGLYSFLADGSGRVIKYNPVTQKNEVLLKDLLFPNGILLSPNEDYLLVAETGQFRILKYYLKGPKMHTSETFIDGLPGAPDNLRWSGKNSLFVPLVVTRGENKPVPLQVISPYPNVRKFLARTLSIIDYLLGEIDKIYPNYYTKRGVHFIGHLESFGVLFTSKTIVLEIDVNGKVIRSFQGYDGSAASISDVIPYNGHLYIGSPSNNFLARVKLSKLGITQSFEPSAPYEASPTPEPATRAPTTTPRPTTTTTTTPRPPPTTRAPPPSSTRPPTTTSAPPPPSTTRRPPPSAPTQNTGQRGPNSLP